MLEELMNNQLIIDMYQKVQDFEDQDPNAWGTHNFKHATNVTKLVTSILTQLNINKENLEDMQVAAMLHDIGAYCGKDGHQQRSYEMAKELIENNKIKVNDKQLVLDAILNHSNGFDLEDVKILALIFSDKMDLTKDRVAPAGREVEGMKEYLHVDSIDITLTNQELIVNYVTDDQCNLKAIEEYYFTEKMIKATKSFAKKLNLIPKINQNNKPWLIK